MKRFFNDDPEDNFPKENLNDDEGDEGEEEEINEEEAYASFSKNDLMDLMGIDVIEAKMNMELLIHATHVAERSTLFWRWRSLHFQLARIHTIYLTFVAMMSPLPNLQDNLDDIPPEGVDDADL